MRLSLLLAAVALASVPAAAQTARLQVIHNAADPAAASVDVYVNGTRLLNDFAFRTATPFIDVPAGVPLSVAVAPGTSTGVGDAVFTRSYTLPAGSRTQLVATGVLAPSSFAANPDFRATAFTLLVGANAAESAPAGQVAVRVVHGATDAPTVDVRSLGAVLVDNAAYTDVTGYLTLPPAAYTLGITTATGDPVARFEAGLSGAGGRAVTVLASGFLTPSANQNGAAFGLLAVFAEGTTALLPAATPTATAQLQVIHNAADPAAALVDVYVNGLRLLDDFAFRSATPFLALPANTNLVVAVAPRTSTSAADAVFTQTFTLPSGRYQLVAQGVLAPSSFAANPDGRPTAFRLLAITNVPEAATTPEASVVRVVHGATDAPTVDVRTGGAVLFDDAAYTDVTAPVEVPAGTYPLLITTGAGAPVAAFSALLGGRAAVTVLASGFLTPAANQNGPAFGLLAVLNDGTTALLPAIPQTARLQVIHNAADPAAASVDVYVNGARLLDNFAFRTATPYIDVPADVALSVAVAPGTSTGVGQAVLTRSFTLPTGSTTQLIATGVLAPASFAPNPGGAPTALDLVVGASARETSDAPSVVAVRVVHGATDAPAVDVLADGALAVDNAAYPAVTGYLSLAAAPYTLAVTLADGSATVASFRADLSAAGGAAATVLASGFLTPAANQNGPAFGLLAVFANGTTALLPVAVASEAPPAPGTLALGAPAPNPLSAAGTVAFSLRAPGRATLALYDVLGRRVAVLADGDFSADRHEVPLGTAGLAAGTYVLRLQTGAGARTRTLSVVR